MAPRPSGQASMKALPKRKGNSIIGTIASVVGASLNESPSEKEGKLEALEAAVQAKLTPQ